MVKKASSSKLKRLGKRKEPEVEEVEISDGDFTLSEGEEEVKPMVASSLQEENEDEDDSDRELQVAFQTGLLKSDRLNFLVPTKRPVINKAEEIRERILSFAKKLPWVETLDITTPSGVNIENAANDFEREVAFYKQAEEAAKQSVPRLKAMGIKVFRPADYYAEMAKSDCHMQKVRKRLLDVQESKEKGEHIRRMRDEKRFATKVHKEVQVKRSEEKKKLMEAVKKHRKGMKGQLEDMLNNARKMNLDEEDDMQRVASRGGSRAEMQAAKRSFSRDARDKKFGYGGQKKRGKSNNKKSFDDVFAGPKGRKGRLGNRKRK